MLDTLGHFKILELVGSNGIGETLRARDTQAGRTVLVTVVDDRIAADPGKRAKFLEDAQAAAKLSHPNIAALYEAGVEGEHVYYASEFVTGEPLHQSVAGRPLNARRAVDLGIQIADALAEAHADGIVHRDLHSGVIVVTPKGNAKILDFGLSAWTTGGDERRAAAAMADRELGTWPGTVGYISPEQAIGELGDARADIFALGVVLYEMTTGRLPFAGSTSSALTMQLLRAQPPPPSTVNKAAPQGIDAIVEKALAKSLDKRYESAATIAAELRAIAAILEVRTAAAEPAAAVRPAAGRKRSSVPLLLAILVLALAALAWFDRGLILHLLGR